MSMLDIVSYILGSSSINKENWAPLGHANVVFDFPEFEEEADWEVTAQEKEG